MLIEALEDRRLLEGTPLVAAQENLEDPAQLLSEEKSSSSESEEVLEELTSGEEGGSDETSSTEGSPQEEEAEAGGDSQREEASDSEDDDDKVDTNSEESQAGDDENEDDKPAVSSSDKDDDNQRDDDDNQRDDDDKQDDDDDEQDDDQDGDGQSEGSLESDDVSQVDEKEESKLVSTEQDDTDDEELGSQDASLSSRDDGTNRPAAETFADNDEQSVDSEPQTADDSEVEGDTDTYFVSTTNSDDDDLPAFSSAEPLGSSRSDDLVAFDSAKPLENSEPENLQAQLNVNNEKIVSARDIQEDSRSRLDASEDESDDRSAAEEALETGDESLARAEKDQNKAQKQFSKLEKGKGNAKSIESRSKSVRKFTDRARSSAEQASRDVASGRQLVDGITGDVSVEQNDESVTLSAEGRVELPDLSRNESGSESNQRRDDGSALGVNANAEIFREPKSSAPFGLSISGSDSDGSGKNDSVSLSLSTPFFTADAALTLDLRDESVASTPESIDSTSGEENAAPIGVSGENKDTYSSNNSIVSGTSAAQEDVQVEPAPAVLDDGSADSLDSNRGVLVSSPSADVSDSDKTDQVAAGAVEITSSSATSTTNDEADEGARGLAPSDPTRGDTEDGVASGEVADQGRFVSTSATADQDDAGRQDNAASVALDAEPTSTDSEATLEEGARSTELGERVTQSDADEKDVNRGRLVSTSSNESDEAIASDAGLDETPEVASSSAQVDESEDASDSDLESSLRPKQEKSLDGDLTSDAPVLGVAPKDQEEKIERATDVSEDENRLDNALRSQEVESAQERLTAVAREEDAKGEVDDSANEESTKVAARVATDDGKTQAIDEPEEEKVTSSEVSALQLHRDDGSKLLATSESAEKERLADAFNEVDETNGKTLRSVDDVQLEGTNEEETNDTLRRVAKSSDTLLASEESDGSPTLVSEKLEQTREESNVVREQRKLGVDPDSSLDEASPGTETLVRDANLELESDLTPESARTTRSAELADNADAAAVVDGRVTTLEDTPSEDRTEQAVQRGTSRSGVSEPVPAPEAQVNEATSQQLAESAKAQTLSKTQLKDSLATSASNVANNSQTGMPEDAETSVLAPALLNVGQESERDGDKESESEEGSDRRDADEYLNRFEVEVASNENVGAINSVEACGPLCPPELETEPQVAAQASNPGIADRATNRVEADVPLGKAVSRKVSSQSPVTAQAELFTSNLLNDDSQFDSTDSSDLPALNQLLSPCPLEDEADADFQLEVSAETSTDDVAEPASLLTAVMSVFAVPKKSRRKLSRRSTDKSPPNREVKE